MTDSQNNPIVLGSYVLYSSGYYGLVVGKVFRVKSELHDGREHTSIRIRAVVPKEKQRWGDRTYDVSIHNPKRLFVVPQNFVLPENQSALII